MNDILGKVTAILVGSFILFGLPILYLAERNETLTQLYLMTETADLVDSVCNTGKLTKEMYYKYQEMLQETGNLYKIQMEHAENEIIVDEEQIKFHKVRHYEQEIMRILEKQGFYRFAQEDYFKISVTKRRRSIRDKVIGYVTGREIPLLNAPIVYYGGRVKYELHKNSN